MNGQSDGIVIRASSITKRFGDVLAVDGVSFEVRRGETYGLLGPNGVGKTTTMRMVSGLSLTFTVVATPLYFFSGAFFPRSVLPDWVEPIAWAAPLTPAVHLARGFVTGDLVITHLFSALYVLAITAVLFPIAAILLHRRLVK